MTAAAACGSCGTGLRENAKYCDECGVPTARSAESAEYKQVTVLFADVVRSMDIAAAVDIERLREIITELVERMAVVVRRFGGVLERTGDGVMALFGAPIALEDHAFRACLAALAVQEETQRLAAEVERRDGVMLQVRVGLNSGQVIAGEIGSGSLGYAATGTHVGMAQRMESVAPPGGVLMSDSTARLVEHLAVLAEPELVLVKGSDEPVRVRKLLAAGPRNGPVGRAETTLIGRRWEMAAIDAIVERAIGGHGGVVNVVGPPGIGKSRVAREAAASAAARGVDVHWTFCESHASDIPFQVVARLLRSGTGLLELDDDSARARVREQLADADPEDLLLLDDLLGIADPDIPSPQIDPDARRRRLSALIKTAEMARSDPALFIIEDAHWVDAVSESMLAEFLTVVPRTASAVLITSRPEYSGALSRVRGAQTIALAPLSDSAIGELLYELLGSDRSITELAAVIADRAAGNPFFAEEMVRELVQREVLIGERGGYVCRTDVADVDVPATVQAAIEARIDRLTAPAKQTLTAASVIGAHFGVDLLTALGIDPVFDELLDAELIDQERFGPNAEYAFHHPLVRAVAYESQLKSNRAEWHRRLAVVIQERDPASVEENAALVAEHLESAGDLHAAYGWHMRAAGWSAIRNVGAARVSWERACRIADSLPADDPAQLVLRTAPRTMLCATDFQAQDFQPDRGRFEELRELCRASGDKVSLAIGMTGKASELNYSGRMLEASRLASEQMALLESIGDPNLTVGLMFVPFINWYDAGEFGELLRWSQTVIELTDGDPAKGAGFGIGSPLALALAFRGVAHWWLGRPGWRRDFGEALAMARTSDATTRALVTGWCYGGIFFGVLRADDSALQACEEVLQSAQAESGDMALLFAQYELGAILLNRDNVADRSRGYELLLEACTWQRERVPSLVPITEVWAAQETFRRGDRDAAITVIRKAVHDLPLSERPGYGVYAMAVLAEALLERGDQGDITQAQDAIDELARVRAGDRWAIRDVTLLRLRALMARALGDDVAYRELVTRYRAMAESLGYEGHIDWAESMAGGL
ncbi:AAA family ATPase [Mycolicibacterium stellerae]|uniref:AAA family ATPase n=1 Tax=Mycolicibacterium stellerae TaxID=2358193 RepID=UPI000F0B3D34|nr:adenylate/guanylate cyclase domain-containing protein [Mycolicibacterium stellerae]